MKAVRIYDCGDSNELLLEDIERPQLGAEDVLVRIHDAGVNPVDWKIREGLRKDKFPVDFPAIVGQDFAGEILEIGSAAKGFSVGDEVYGFAKGPYSEISTASVQSIALKPRSLDFTHSAAIPTAGLTAWQCLIEIAQIRKGQSVLIHGAGSGVGSFAVQIAKWKGARVIATAAKDDKKYLTHIGVDKVIDYQSEKFEERLHDLDVILDLVGGETQRKSLKIVKRGGVIVSTVSGLDPQTLSELGIRGESMIMHQDSRGLIELARLADQGKLLPRMGEVLPLADASKAQDLLQKGHPHGKVVLKV